MSLTVEIRKRLGDFQLEVQFETDGGPLALLGASGCGKSVTLRCIAGLLTPDEGRITLDGRPLYDSAAGIDLPPQRRQVGFLFQNYALFPHMSVRQNIAAGAADRNGRNALAAELLRRFHLEEAADLRPGQLSGGQQQRTALARLLAARPRLLLLDEPLSALDSYLRLQLEAELAETLDHFPGPTLWVTHDRGEAFRNCRRVCVLDRGRSQPVQTLEDLFAHPGTEAAARLSGCENYADVLPDGCLLHLPAWGLTWDFGRPAPPALRRVGFRAAALHLASAESENAFACTVVRAIQDLHATVLLLRPDVAPHGAPPLRMEVDQSRWQSLPDPAHITVSLPPAEILPLG